MSFRWLFVIVIFGAFAGCAIQEMKQGASGFIKMTSAPGTLVRNCLIKNGYKNGKKKDVVLINYNFQDLRFITAINTSLDSVSILENVIHRCDKKVLAESMEIFKNVHANSSLKKLVPDEMQRFSVEVYLKEGAIPPSKMTNSDGRIVFPHESLWEIMSERAKKSTQKKKKRRIKKLFGF